MITDLSKLDCNRIEGEFSVLYTAEFPIVITLKDLYYQAVDSGTYRFRFKNELLGFLEKGSSLNSELKDIFYAYYNNDYNILDYEYCNHCISNYGDLNLTVRKTVTCKTFKRDGIDYIYFFPNLVDTSEPLVWKNNSYLSKKYPYHSLKIYAWVWYCINDFISSKNPTTLILFSVKLKLKSWGLLFKKAVNKYGYTLEINKRVRDQYNIKNNNLWRKIIPETEVYQVGGNYSEFFYEFRLEK